MESNKKIFVTQSLMPDLGKFVKYLEDIWERKYITNNGVYHQKFEKAICDHLGVENCSLMANGTLALMIGLQALEISGEVITTHALHWNNIKPVFCDINPDTFNLDVQKIESLITEKTTAILPTHIYGNPCEMDKLEKIGDTYGLKIVYDAAHAFGVKKDGKSILNYGDLSILSFHATKTFNTTEGGAIITKDKKLKEHIDHLKNFGFANEVTVIAHGINAKMNEMQAAYGLLELEIINDEIKKRKAVATLYRKELSGLDGITIFHDMENVDHNYSYFPILINKEKFGLSGDQVYDEFRKKNIYVRRYFYPLISNFATYNSLPSANAENLPIAEKISEQVLCLPIYGELELLDVKMIGSIIKKLKN